MAATLKPFHSVSSIVAVLLANHVQHKTNNFPVYLFSAIEIALAPNEMQPICNTVGTEASGGKHTAANKRTKKNRIFGFDEVWR